MAGKVERIAVALLAGIVGGLGTFAAVRGLGLPTLAAVAVATIAAVAGTVWLAPRLPRALDGLRRTRPLVCIAWLGLALATVAQTARLTSFMVDPRATQHSILPTDEWTVGHCCLTAYTEGARFARDEVPNVYQPSLYKPNPRQDRQLEGFTVDLYHYPPPFLLLPLAVEAAAGGGFLETRTLWYGLTSLVLLLALCLLAVSFEGPARLRAIGLAPLIWCSLPVQLGLQMSNFQILVVSLSVLAFVSFPRVAGVGGALLAVGAVSKIFPGIVGLYLVARRRWRDAAWTVGLAIAFCATAYAVLGGAPFRAFVEFALPRLSTGEAFEGPLGRPVPVARNMAPFGLPLKLVHLGIGLDGMAVGRLISLMFGVIVLALCLWASRRRPGSSDDEAAIWLALLSLGTLVSPFAPASYVLTSLVWLVCVDRRLGRPAVVAGVWLLTAIPLLFPRDAPYITQLFVFLPAQVLAVVIPSLVLVRAGRRPSGDEAGTV